jgi:hypothetical protein
MKKSNKSDVSKSTGSTGPRRAGAAARPYAEMTTDELRRATAEFDREFVGDTFGPPTARQRAALARARRKRGRPRVGAGAKTISVTVEEGLLLQADRLAKRLHVPRAVLIARGLRAVVTEEVTLEAQ